MTPGQSRLGSDGNEGILPVPQSSIITESSPKNCLVTYPGHSLGWPYPSAEKQLTVRPHRGDRCKFFDGQPKLVCPCIGQGEVIYEVVLFSLSCLARLIVMVCEI